MTIHHERTSLEKTLPRQCYLTTDFFAREQQHILYRDWFCVARASDFKQVGDYRVIRVGGESLILVQSDNAVFHAFHNVCRHRGSQLVSQPACEVMSGRFRHGIRCPYHSWRYALNGQLQITPHLDIDRDTLGLHTVELDTWGGFLFVRLSGGQNAPSLLDSLGDIVTRVQRYPLQDLRVGKRLSYQVRANWKVILENYNECYHCAGVHPELCKIVPAFRQNGGSGLDWERGIPHREGANTFSFSGTTVRQPFPGLNEDEKRNHKGELIYPNLMISLAMDHVAAFTLWPRAFDHTEVVCDFLFHADEISTPGFDPQDAVEFWDVTNLQDWDICENVQRGMQSMTFEHGYYAPMEDLSLDIRNYILGRIPDAQAGPVG